MLNHKVVLFAAALALVGYGGWASAAPYAGRNGFATRLTRQLSLSAEQQEALRGVMADQRQQMANVRTQTDAKIRGLLTPEQQAKFDSLQAKQKSRTVRK